MALLHTRSVVCPVCAGDSCIGFPDSPHLIDYPFIGGGVEPMAQEPFVIADRRIFDEQQERLIYGVGDHVPLTEAVKYGLVEPDARAARPKQNRARKPREDRGK